MNRIISLHAEAMFDYRRHELFGRDTGCHATRGMTRERNMKRSEFWVGNPLAIGIVICFPHRPLAKSNVARTSVHGTWALFCLLFLKGRC